MLEVGAVYQYWYTNNHGYRDISGTVTIVSNHSAEVVYDSGEKEYLSITRVEDWLSLYARTLLSGSNAVITIERIK